MSRPYKDPVGKAEKTVNQILKKMDSLERLARAGHITLKQVDKIQDAIDERGAKLRTAIRKFNKPEEPQPFKLS